MRSRGWRRFWRYTATVLGRIRQAWVLGHHPAAGATKALLFTIQERPRPRDTGTFSIYCCGTLIAESENLSLFSDDPQPLLDLLRMHSADLRMCNHHQVRFRNISPWLKGHILEEMRELQIRVSRAAR